MRLEAALRQSVQRPKRDPPHAYCQDVEHGQFGSHASLPVGRSVRLFGHSDLPLRTCPKKGSFTGSLSFAVGALLEARGRHRPSLLRRGRQPSAAQQSCVPLGTALTVHVNSEALWPDRSRSLEGFVRTLPRTPPKGVGLGDAPRAQRDGLSRQGIPANPCCKSSR